MKLEYVASYTAIFLCMSGGAQAITHPGCLVDANRISSIRGDLSGPRLALRNAIILPLSAAPYSTAMAYADFSSLSLSSDEVGGVILQYTAAYLATSQTQYLNQAVSILNDLNTNYTFWNFGDDSPTDLGFAGILRAAALTYDWAFADLNSTQKSQLQSLLDSRGAALYAAATTDNPPVFWSSTFLQNHNWSGWGSLALAACARQGEQSPDSTAQWFAGAVSNFQAVQSRIESITDGTWHEGVQYQGTMMWIVQATQALKNAGLTDLLSTSTYWSNYVKFKLGTYMPQMVREYPVPFGDYFNWDTFEPAFLRWQASRVADGSAMWLADQWRASQGHVDGVLQPAGSYPSYPPDNSQLVWELIFWDTGVASTPPQSVTKDFFGQDLALAVLRGHPATGGETLMSLKAGAYGGNSNWSRLCQAHTNTTELNFGHDHADDNSIYLTYGGTHLITSEGYNIGHSDSGPIWDDTTKYFNSLVLDAPNQGQLSTCDTYYNGSGYQPCSTVAEGFKGTNATLFASSNNPFPWFCTRSANVTQIGSTTSYGYALGQGSALYDSSAGLTRFDRHAFLSRSAGGRYGVVRDVIEATVSHTYKILWNFPGAITTSGAWIEGSSIDGSSNVVGVYAAAPASAGLSTSSFVPHHLNKFLGNASMYQASVALTSPLPNANFLHVLVPMGALSTQQWSSLPTISHISSDTDGSLQVAGSYTSGASDVETWVFNRLRTDDRISGTYHVRGQAGVVGTTPSGALLRVAVFGGNVIGSTTTGDYLNVTMPGNAQADLAEARWNGTSVYVESSTATFNPAPPNSTAPVAFTVLANGATQAFLNGNSVPVSSSGGFLYYPSNIILSVTLSGPSLGVSSSPAGISCGTTCTAIYGFGTAVTLSASAGSNASFTGWSGGGCAGTGTCGVTMNSAVSVTASSSCNTNYSACSGVCVNEHSDANNCGACGNACSTGTCCNSQCVNEATDVNNCGSCGYVCPLASNASSMTCAGTGQCFIKTCNGGYALCDVPNPSRPCQNITSDVNNCGGCGQTCPGGVPNGSPSCTNGACGITCNAGYTLCGNSCVNETNDLHNCGACGYTCPNPAHGGGTCSNRICGFVCNSGYKKCGDTCILNSARCQ